MRSNPSPHLLMRSCLSVPPLTRIILDNGKLASLKDVQITDVSK
jgi:hypothetical protein